MFSADRWAEAYCAACETNGEDPSQGLALLEAVLPLAGKFGRTMGTQAADKFISMVKQAARKTAVTGNNAALALVWLFVRRGYAKNGAGLADAIGRLIDKRKGVLRAELETASEDGLNADFLRDLETVLAEKYCANAVRISAAVKPELLCGYRCTVGGERADYSLAGKLAQMERTLDKTVFNNRSL
ncbi:MAG: F0F1 ATP synthase subunit delta [Spirochaetaceae bacterium]|jgi:F0F1-type ATP synthase delta subunit|nr:F0F1 ATP synthase subunit delta [Spirochaetaceae bacterium]